MANVQVKDATASSVYLKASGAGSDPDPHIIEHLDTNSAAMLTALQAIQTAVQLIDNMISGSEAQVDVVTSALPSGAATEATLAAIQTAVELIDNMISGSEAQVDVVTSALPSGAATEATLAAIQTAVELIDNMISGSEAQVDVVTSALPTGAATETTLSSIDTALAAIQTAVELIDNMISGSEAQVDVVTSALPSGAATESTLDSIKTAVEVIDNIVSGSEAQVDVVASLPAGTNTIGAVAQAPATSGGYSIYRDLDIDETGINIKASAGQVFGWYIHNAAASDRYLKLYNKATAPTVGTDTPVLTIPIPAGAAANVEFLGGIAFATGIGIGCTTAVGDADTGAPSANDVQVNIFYK